MNQNSGDYELGKRLGLDTAIKILFKRTLEVEMNGAVYHNLIDLINEIRAEKKNEE